MLRTIRYQETQQHLTRLCEMACIRPFQVGKDHYYTLTSFSIREFESGQESSVEGEVSTSRVGLDLDTDLNTPESTEDGALDWMGVAHMLGIEGTVPGLVGLGPRVPMLRLDQVLFFADDNSKPFERKVIEDRGIAEVRLAAVVADPSGAARSVVDGWAQRFDRLLVHLDLDVLDYLDMPLAEERRRNRGLRFVQLMASLRVLLQARNWVGLTVTELNPDHGENDGSTLRSFAESLSEALSSSPRLRSD